MTSTQELISKIAERMQNNSILCPLIFDDTGQAYNYVRDGLLRIADFHIAQLKKSFVNLQVQDIALVGGMASYIYNGTTDIDLIIIATLDVPDADPQKTHWLFRMANRGRLAKGYRFRLFERTIDYWMAEPSTISAGSGLYSLTKNQWLKRPVHREFSYTPEEATEQYKAYCDNVQAYVNSLEKIDGKWLTFESCRKLDDFIEQLKKEAMEQKENGPEQEYGIEYNCYRFFCKFGVKQHFFDIITESQNQLINGLEASDE